MALLLLSIVYYLCRDYYLCCTADCALVPWTEDVLDAPDETTSGAITKNYKQAIDS